MTQLAVRPAWLIASLLVLAVVLSACSASPPKGGALAGSESPGSAGAGAAPAAGTGTGPGATGAPKPSSSSGPSGAKQAARAANTTTTAVNRAAGPGSVPGPASTSGSATVAPDASTDAGSSDGSDPSVTIGGFSSDSGSATPTPAPTCDPTVQPVQAVGITDVQMARVDAAGTIHLTNSFSSATDRKIMAVVALDDKVAVTGTIITFVRILGCTYTPSQTYTLTRPLTHYEVQFDATAGKPFARGHYRLRFYVNKKAGWDVAYDVH